MLKNKKFNRNYGKFAAFNKRIRESNIAPDPYKELDKHGVPGKVVKKTAEIMSAESLHTASYGATGILYNPKKHSSYFGSVVYTAFYILFRALMSMVAFVKIFFLIFGALLKIKKW